LYQISNPATIKQSRSALFWVITQHIVVNSYR